VTLHQRALLFHLMRPRCRRSQSKFAIIVPNRKTWKSCPSSPKPGRPSMVRELFPARAIVEAHGLAERDPRTAWLRGQLQAFVLVVEAWLRARRQFELWSAEPLVGNASRVGEEAFLLVSEPASLNSSHPTSTARRK